MRKEIVILLCTFIIATLIGCGLPNQTKSQRTYTIANASYDISLLSVEKSTGSEKVYEKQRIETVLEEGITKFYFEDDMMRIKWRPTSNDISFVVHNKADNPVKIVWDEGKFIDAEGVTHRLIHSGIGYEERNDSQRSTIIAARGSLEDFVHPADYFQWEKWSSKQQGYWKRASFMPTQIKGTAEELRTKAEPFVGKTFQVILALQIDDVRNDYVCTFKINNVDVTEKEQQPEKKSNGSRKGNMRRAF